MATSGAKVTEETSWLAGLIMNIVFLLGLFTFAVVLGIISEEIKTQVPSVQGCKVAQLQAQARGTDARLHLPLACAAVNQCLSCAGCADDVCATPVPLRSVRQCVRAEVCACLRIYRRIDRK